MAGYVKLFQSILDSTIWKQPAPITKVWLTMMAMADRDGVVQAAIPGLASRSNVSLATTEKALALFLAPDPYSKTPDNEGRRIEVVRGGWRLLNYEMHREMMSAEDQRTKNAERQQRWRDRQRNAGVTAVTSSNAECDIQNQTQDPIHLAPRGSGSGPAGARSNSEAGIYVPRDRRITGTDLLRIFGEIRCQEWGGLPWQKARDANGKSADMAEIIGEAEGAVEFVVPTMRLLFAKAKANQAGQRSGDILRNPAFGFGAWCSMWHQLVEEVTGAARKVPNMQEVEAAQRASRGRIEIEQQTRATDEKLARDKTFTPMTAEQIEEMRKDARQLAEAKSA